ncbi:hypothetical protein EON82_21840 [bacterium]|nr:MAG: hypothetical protein EON82_21840 [bacterium]
MNAYRIVAEYADGEEETAGWVNVKSTLPLLNVDRPQPIESITGHVSTVTIGKEGEWPYFRGSRDPKTPNTFETVDPQGRPVRLHIRESMLEIALDAWKEAGAPVNGLEIMIKRTAAVDGLLLGTYA